MSEEMKKLISDLDRKHDGLRYRIFGAMQRGEIDGFRTASPMQGIRAYQNEEESL